MKKKAAFIISLLFYTLLPTSAQWYLFPGSPQTRNSQDSTLKVEHKQDTLIVDDGFVLDLPQTLNIALMLPFNASTKPSGNFLDFYCGALMAIQAKGEAGQKIELNVFDTGNHNMSMQTAALELNDLIIGPVKLKEIQDLLPSLPEEKFIVSPLEKKTEELVSQNRVIQAPSSWKTQSEELVKWLLQDVQARDMVVLMREDGIERPGEQASYMIKLLESSGIPYSSVFASNINGLKSLGTIRVIIASDNDLFTSSSINNLSKLTATDNFVLYGTSRIRSLEGINIESLYKLNTRLTTGYYIDYSDPKVQDFVLKYRGLYHSEPSSFSFQGYDILNYFIGMNTTYGRQWYKKLYAEPGKGLQSDFKFKKTDTVGKENTSVRRLLYNTDLSISVK